MEVSNIKERKLSRAQEFLKAFKRASPESKAQGMAAYKFERMMDLAERKIMQSNRQATAQSSSMAEALAMELLHRPGSLLTTQEIAKIYEESECAEVIEEPPNCDSIAVQKHRTADGTCNNLEDPTRGAAATSFRRLITARYDNGCNRPIGFLQSQSSDLLSFGPFEPPHASPRIASRGIVEDRLVDDDMHTHILMQWGQFMDHDLDLIPEFEHCPEGCEISSEEEGMCYPFLVPGNDNTILTTSVDGSSEACHEFRRSLPVCPPEDRVFTDPYVREQLNAITHFIDGSMVYHHDPDVQANLIRDPNSPIGLLRVGDLDQASKGILYLYSCILNACVFNLTSLSQQIRIQKIDSYCLMQ